MVVGFGISGCHQQYHLKICRKFHHLHPSAPGQWFWDVCLHRVTWIMSGNHELWNGWWYFWACSPWPTVTTVGKLQFSVRDSYTPSLVRQPSQVTLLLMGQKSMKNQLRYCETLALLRPERLCFSPGCCTFLEPVGSIPERSMAGNRVLKFISQVTKWRLPPLSGGVHSQKLTVRPWK